MLNSITLYYFIFQLQYLLRNCLLYQCWTCTMYASLHMSKLIFAKPSQWKVLQRIRSSQPLMRVRGQQNWFWRGEAQGFQFVNKCLEDAIHALGRKNPHLPKVRFCFLLSSYASCILCVFFCFVSHGYISFSIVIWIFFSENKQVCLLF